MFKSALDGPIDVEVVPGLVQTAVEVTRHGGWLPLGHLAASARYPGSCNDVISWSATCGVRETRQRWNEKSPGMRKALE